MLTAASYHAAPLNAAFILAPILRPLGLLYGIPGGPPSEAIKAEKLSPALRTKDESAGTAPPPKPTGPKPSTSQVWWALLPWIIVCIVLLLWGTNWFKGQVNPWATWAYPVPELHNMINKVAPVAPKPTPEGAVFAFTWLSYTGSGMLIAAIIWGLIGGFSPVQLVKSYAPTMLAR